MRMNKRANTDFRVRKVQDDANDQSVIHRTGMTRPETIKNTELVVPRGTNWERGITHAYRTRRRGILSIPKRGGKGENME